MNSNRLALFQQSNRLIAGRRVAEHHQQFDTPRLTQRFVIPKLQQGDSYYGVVRLDQFRVADSTAYKDHVHLNRLQTRLQISTDPLRDLGHSQGDIKLQNVRYWLNHLGPWIRSSDQKMFHEHFLTACLPHIYGKDWAANGARVMSSLGLDKIDYEVLIQTPRRFGKTISVAMFVAVLALMCPGIKISIFSTGSRASKAMTDRILQFVNYIPGGTERKIKHSKEELMFSARPLGKSAGPGSALAKEAENYDDTSQIKSYPASVDTMSHRIDQLSELERLAIENNTMDTQLQHYIAFRRMGKFPATPLLSTLIYTKGEREEWMKESLRQSNKNNFNQQVEEWKKLNYIGLIERVRSIKYKTDEIADEVDNKMSEDIEALLDEIDTLMEPYNINEVEKELRSVPLTQEELRSFSKKYWAEEPKSSKMKAAVEEAEALIQTLSGHDFYQSSVQGRPSAQVLVSGLMDEKAYQMSLPNTINESVLNKLNELERLAIENNTLDTKLQHYIAFRRIGVKEPNRDFHPLVIIISHLDELMDYAKGDQTKLMYEYGTVSLEDYVRSSNKRGFDKQVWFWETSNWPELVTRVRGIKERTDKIAEAVEGEMTEEIEELLAEIDTLMEPYDVKEAERQLRRNPMTFDEIVDFREKHWAEGEKRIKLELAVEEAEALLKALNNHDQSSTQGKLQAQVLVSGPMDAKGEPNDDNSISDAKMNDYERMKEKLDEIERLAIENNALDKHLQNYLVLRRKSILRWKDSATQTGGIDYDMDQLKDYVKGGHTEELKAAYQHLLRSQNKYYFNEQVNDWEAENCYLIGRIRNIKSEANEMAEEFDGNMTEDIEVQLGEIDTLMEPYNLKEVEKELRRVPMTAEELRTFCRKYWSEDTALSKMEEAVQEAEALVRALSDHDLYQSSVGERVPGQESSSDSSSESKSESKSKSSATTTRRTNKRNRPTSNNKSNKKTQRDAESSDSSSSESEETEMSDTEDDHSIMEELRDIVYSDEKFDQVEFLKVWNKLKRPAYLFDWIYGELSRTPGTSRLNSEMKKNMINSFLPVLQKNPERISYVVLFTLFRLCRLNRTYLEDPDDPYGQSLAKLEKWINQTRAKYYPDFTASREYFLYGIDSCVEQDIETYGTGGGYDDKHRHLSRAFRNAPRTKNINFVFRGVKEKLKDVFLSGWEYQSTSFDIRVAASYTGNDDGVVLLIRIPPGSQIFNTIGCANHAEMEILLHRGSYKLIPKKDQPEFLRQLKESLRLPDDYDLPENVLFCEYVPPVWDDDSEDDELDSEASESEDTKMSETEDDDDQSMVSSLMDKLNLRSHSYIGRAESTESNSAMEPQQDTAGKLSNDLAHEPPAENMFCQLHDLAQKLDSSSSDASVLLKRVAEAAEQELHVDELTDLWLDVASATGTFNWIGHDRCLSGQLQPSFITWLQDYRNVCKLAATNNIPSSSEVDSLVHHFASMPLESVIEPNKTETLQGEVIWTRQGEDFVMRIRRAIRHYYVDLLNSKTTGATLKAYINFARLSVGTVANLKKQDGGGTQCVISGHATQKSNTKKQTFFSKLLGKFRKQKQTDVSGKGDKRKLGASSSPDDEDTGEIIQNSNHNRDSNHNNNNHNSPMRDVSEEDDAQIVQNHYQTARYDPTETSNNRGPTQEDMLQLYANHAPGSGVLSANYSNDDNSNNNNNNNASLISSTKPFKRLRKVGADQSSSNTNDDNKNLQKGKIQAVQKQKKTNIKKYFTADLIEKIYEGDKGQTDLPVRSKDSKLRWLGFYERVEKLPLDESIESLWNNMFSFKDDDFFFWSADGTSQQEDEPTQQQDRTRAATIDLLRQQLKWVPGVFDLLEEPRKQENAQRLAFLIYAIPQLTQLHLTLLNNQSTDLTSALRAKMDVLKHILSVEHDKSIPESNNLVQSMLDELGFVALDLTQKLIEMAKLLQLLEDWNADVPKILKILKDNFIQVKDAAIRDAKDVKSKKIKNTPDAAEQDDNDQKGEEKKEHDLSAIDAALQQYHALRLFEAKTLFLKGDLDTFDLEETQLKQLEILATPLESKEGKKFELRLPVETLTELKERHEEEKEDAKETKKIELARIEKEVGQEEKAAAKQLAKLTERFSSLPLDLQVETFTYRQMGYPLRRLWIPVQAGYQLSGMLTFLTTTDTQLQPLMQFVAENAQVSKQIDQTSLYAYNEQIFGYWDFLFDILAELSGISEDILRRNKWFLDTTDEGIIAELVAAIGEEIELINRYFGELHPRIKGERSKVSDVNTQGEVPENIMDEILFIIATADACYKRLGWILLPQLQRRLHHAVKPPKDFGQAVTIEIANLHRIRSESRSNKIAEHELQYKALENVVSAFGFNRETGKQLIYHILDNTEGDSQTIYDQRHWNSCVLERYQYWKVLFAGVDISVHGLIDENLQLFQNVHASWNVMIGDVKRELLQTIEKLFDVEEGDDMKQEKMSQDFQLLLKSVVTLFKHYKINLQKYEKVQDVFDGILEIDDSRGLREFITADTAPARFMKETPASENSADWSQKRDAVRAFRSGLVAAVDRKNIKVRMSLNHMDKLRRQALKYYLEYDRLRLFFLKPFFFSSGNAVAEISKKTFYGYFTKDVIRQLPKKTRFMSSEGSDSMRAFYGRIMGLQQSYEVNIQGKALAQEKLEEHLSSWSKLGNDIKKYLKQAEPELKETIEYLQAYGKKMVPKKVQGGGKALLHQRLADIDDETDDDALQPEQNSINRKEKKTNEKTKTQLGNLDRGKYDAQLHRLTILQAELAKFEIIHKFVADSVSRYQKILDQNKEGIEWMDIYQLFVGHETEELAEYHTHLQDIDNRFGTGSKKRKMEPQSVDLRKTKDFIVDDSMEDNDNDIYDFLEKDYAIKESAPALEFHARDEMELTQITGPIVAPIINSINNNNQLAVVKREPGIKLESDAQDMPKLERITESKTVVDLTQEVEDIAQRLPADQIEQFMRMLQQRMQQPQTVKMEIETSSPSNNNNRQLDPLARTLQFRREPMLLIDKDEQDSDEDMEQAPTGARLLSSFHYKNIDVIGVPLTQYALRIYYGILVCLRETVTGRNIIRSAEMDPETLSHIDWDSSSEPESVDTDAKSTAAEVSDEAWQAKIIKTIQEVDDAIYFIRNRRVDVDLRQFLESLDEVFDAVVTQEYAQAENDPYVLERHQFSWLRNRAKATTAANLVQALPRQQKDKYTATLKNYVRKEKSARYRYAVLAEFKILPRSYFANFSDRQYNEQKRAAEQEWTAADNELQTMYEEEIIPLVNGHSSLNRRENGQVWASIRANGIDDAQNEKKEQPGTQGKLQLKDPTLRPSVLLQKRLNMQRKAVAIPIHVI